MVSTMAEMFRRTRREMGWDFDPAAKWLVPVRMKVDRTPFDEAWNWCSENCQGKWRYEGAPREGGVLFLFEVEDDGVLFALRF
jgi:hypothetical protein